MQSIAIRKMAEYLAALGSEHRLKIVELLGDGERCVCELTPEFDLDPSVVSRHLAVLEQAGVIVSRRDGRWIHYRLADRRVQEMVVLAHQLCCPVVKTGSATRPGRPRKTKC